jgi:hypothetical protein
MSDNTVMMNDGSTMSVEQLMANLRAEGLKIDPETADVVWQHAEILDPYGFYRDLPDECRQVGRVYFARSPESDIWVSFHDLPEATRNALWNKLDSGHFPSGGDPLARLVL